MNDSMNMSGFSVNLFLRPPKERELCPTCKNVLNDPRQCLNGHVFCHMCLKKSVIETRKCPICMRSMTEKDLDNKCQFAREAIDDLQVKCKCHMTNTNSEDCCDWTGAVSEMVVRECSHIRQKCINRGCEQLIQKRHMTQHSTECLKRLLTCDLCDSKVQFDALSDHALVCVGRNYICECGEQMKYSAHSSHVSNSCPHGFVICPFQAENCCDATCTGRLMRCDLREHYADYGGSAFAKLLLRKTVTLPPSLCQPIELPQTLLVSSSSSSKPSNASSSSRPPQTGSTVSAFKSALSCLQIPRRSTGNSNIKLIPTKSPVVATSSAISSPRVTNKRNAVAAKTVKQQRRRRSATLTLCEFDDEDDDSSSESTSDSDYAEQSSTEHDNVGTKVRAARLSNGRSKPCLVCGRTFANDSYLLMHKQSETMRHFTTKLKQGAFTFQCLHCGIYFKNQDHLDLHVANFRQCRTSCINDDTVSDNSSASSESEKETTEHDSIVRRERPRKHLCQVCGKGFKSLSDVKRHVEGVTILHGFSEMYKDDCTHQCTSCSLYFSSESNLHEHQQTFHCNGAITAERRGNETTLASLQKSLTSSISNRKRKIDSDSDSKETDASSSESEKEASVHNKSDKNEAALRRERPRKYLCKVCTKDFKYPSDVIRHAEGPTVQHLFSDAPRDDHPHQCSTCNLYFSSETNLNLHQRKFHCDNSAVASTVVRDAVQSSSVSQTSPRKNTISLNKQTSVVSSVCKKRIINLDSEAEFNSEDDNRIGGGDKDDSIVDDGMFSESFYTTIKQYNVLTDVNNSLRKKPRLLCGNDTIVAPIMTSQDMVPCLVCGQKFTTKSHLKNHQDGKTSHNFSDTATLACTFHCVHCGIYFSCYDHLASHKQNFCESVSANKICKVTQPNQCVVCAKICPTQANFLRHIKGTQIQHETAYTTSTLFPVGCECGLYFMTEQNKEEHSRNFKVCPSTNNSLQAIAIDSNSNLNVDIHKGCSSNGGGVDVSMTTEESISCEVQDNNNANGLAGVAVTTQRQLELELQKDSVADVVPFTVTGPVSTVQPQQLDTNSTIDFVSLSTAASVVTTQQVPVLQNVMNAVCPSTATIVTTQQLQHDANSVTADVIPATASLNTQEQHDSVMNVIIPSLVIPTNEPTMIPTVVSTSTPVIRFDRIPMPRDVSTVPIVTVTEHQTASPRISRFNRLDENISTVSCVPSSSRSGVTNTTLAELKEKLLQSMRERER